MSLFFPLPWCNLRVMRIILTRNGLLFLLFLLLLLLLLLLPHNVQASDKLEDPDQHSHVSRGTITRWPFRALSPGSCERCVHWT